MRVLNHTLYDTMALRRLFFYAMKKVGIKDSTKRIWHVTYAKKSKKALTTYAKQFRLSGLAVLGHINRRGNMNVANVVWLGLSPYGTTNGTYLAQVVIHELQHNLGIKHEDMENCIHIGVSDLPEDLKLLRKKKGKKEASNGVHVVKVKMREVWEERSVPTGNISGSPRRSAKGGKRWMGVDYP